jgi:hypothetical protein
VLTLLIYSLLTASAFYLGSRAKVTEWVWTKYPPAFARFMDCAACSGAWYGLIAALLLRDFLPTTGIRQEVEPIVIGLCSVVWTPVVAGLMQAGFERLGSAVAEEVTDDDQGDH